MAIWPRGLASRQPRPQGVGRVIAALFWPRSGAHHTNSQSSGARSGAPRGREYIKEPCHRAWKRTDRKDEPEAHREQQCPFRRNAVVAEERDDGEFPQAPAADGDRDEGHAKYDRE